MAQQAPNAIKAYVTPIWLRLIIDLLSLKYLIFYVFFFLDVDLDVQISQRIGKLYWIYKKACSILCSKSLYNKWQQSLEKQYLINEMQNNLRFTY